MTDYTPIITLVKLMKEKRNIYVASHELHTIRVPDKWHPDSVTMCTQRWQNKGISNPSRTGRQRSPSPGAAQRLVAADPTQKQHTSSLLATACPPPEKTVLSRTIIYFSRPHYRIQSVFFLPENLLRLWSICFPTADFHKRGDRWIFLPAI